MRHTNLSVDRFGTCFDKNKVIYHTGDKQLTENDISLNTVIIVDKKKNKHLYFWSHLKENFKNNHYIRVKQPNTKNNLLNKLPGFSSAAAEFEAQAANYNAGVLNKNPKFIGILTTYVKAMLHSSDFHPFYSKPHSVKDRRDSLRDFYAQIEKLDPLERTAFNSLFITNRKEFSSGNLFIPPVKWDKEKAGTVENRGHYRPCPLRSVILEDTFKKLEAVNMHSWGMDVLHLLLQYHIGTNRPFEIFDKTHPAYEMENSLRNRITSEETCVVKGVRKGLLNPQKGIDARDTIEDFVDREISLEKLIQDMIANVNQLRTRYFESETINKICETIENYHPIGKTEKSNQEALMASLMRISSIALKTSSKESNAVLFICQVFTHYQANFSVWPDIATLEELISAEQKRRLLEDISNNAAKFSDNAKTAFENLCDQIRHSHARTTWNDIFNDNSQCLHASIKVNDGVDSCSIQTVINAIPRTNKYLTEIKEYIAINSPKTFISSDSSDSIQNEETWRIRSLAVHTALIKMRHNYINRTHDDKIDNLIQVVTGILNTKGEDNQTKYDSIVAEVQKAFDIQQNNFINKTSICGFFKRTAAQFAATIKNNLNSYCYPRSLQNILAQHKPSEQLSVKKELKFN